MYYFSIDRVVVCVLFFFFFQAEDGIRDLVRSRGLGDVYKRQFVDTGPVLERYWARASGAAAVGKNGLCLRPDAGSRFFIGIIVTTLHCPPSEPAPGDPCAGCDLCPVSYTHLTLPPIYPR